MSDLPVISIKNLSKSFKETKAVSDLSLEIHRGEIFGVLGHNGAGKTTTIRLINGLMEPDNGKVNVLGLDPMVDGPELRSQTGVLTESPSLEERLTAFENLFIFAKLYGLSKEAAQLRAQSLLDEFGLSERANEKVRGYSKGMKQRLALARSLLHRPEILFLDEPTSGLDPMASRSVQELIFRQARQEGHTIFLCTHNLLEAQKVCDRVAVLEQGRLIELGTPTELAQRLVTRLNVEVEIAKDDIPLTIQLLENMKPVAHNPQCNNGTVVFTAAGRDSIPKVLSELVSNNILVYRLTNQEPTLEDVYFALHGKEVINHE